MAMVDVRSVGMRVPDRLVPMLVRMRLPGRILRRVRVLVVLVVDVPMLVLQRLVAVHVRMLRADEAEDPGAEDRRRNQLPRSEAVAEHRHRHQRSDEGRDGKERRMPRERGPVDVL
jgi:hypothetical protein